MIVRILGEGQRELPADALPGAERARCRARVGLPGRRARGFSTALAALLNRVRELGTVVPDDYLGPSDLVLPSADASLTEVRELFTE